MKIIRQFIVQMDIICLLLILFCTFNLKVQGESLQSGSSYMVKNLIVTTSKNMGILSDKVTVRVEVTTEAERKIKNFSVSYPREEIAEHIRTEMQKLYSLDNVFNKEHNLQITKKECLIKFIPQWDNVLGTEKDQTKTIQFSIPRNYFVFVNFVVEIGGKRESINPPSETRTDVIHTPGKNNEVINFD